MCGVTAHNPGGWRVKPPRTSSNTSDTLARTAGGGARQQARMPTDTRTKRCRHAHKDTARSRALSNRRAEPESVAESAHDTHAVVPHRNANTGPYWAWKRRMNSCIEPAAFTSGKLPSLSDAHGSVGMRGSRPPRGAGWSRRRHTQPPTTRMSAPTTAVSTYTPNDIRRRSAYTHV